MTVYVESNFVLEYGLEQDEVDSCEGMLNLAAAGELRLLVPAFSLAEPHQAIAAKAKARVRLGEDLRQQLGELGRSRAHREMPRAFGALAEALLKSAELERTGLRSAISRMIQVAEVIPLDTRILTMAATVEDQYRLSGQDALVLASILTHLEGAEVSESCFVNRNWKDFGDPGIRERLEQFGCKFFARFETALGYVSHRIK